MIIKSKLSVWIAVVSIVLTADHPCYFPQLPYPGIYYSS